MLDNKNTTTYTPQQAEEIARHAAQYAVEQFLSAQHLDNRTAEEETPTMEGDNNMGRQRIHITLPSGEMVWITGATYSDLIQNALNKYSASQHKVQSMRSESFREYTDKIFDVFLRPRWKPSTADTNKFLLDKHILPYFSELTLTDIDVATVQKFFQTKQHLSRSYTKQMLIMLHEIFENAIEDGIVSDDPTQSKRITLPQKETKRNALEPDQFYDIVSNVGKLDKDEALLIMLLCFTGMRRGEVLGLKWDCVFESSIIVKAEVIFKGNTPVYNEYTKSAAGIREVPIPKELAPFLQDAGVGFVFGGDEPYTQSKFDRMWQRISKKINLYGATPHVFRHTYLSTLAASNVDPKTIQALAGHADFSFTFNKYINRNKSNMQDAGEVLSDHIEKLTQKLTQAKQPEPNNINASEDIPDLLN